MDQIKGILFILYFMLLIYGVKAQNVSFNYQKKSLSYILSDIERQYAVSFSYAKNRLNLAKIVSFKIQNQPLKISLERFFRANNIEFAKFGNQWVLKNGKVKPKLGYYPIQKKNHQPVPSKKIVKELPAVKVSRTDDAKSTKSDLISIKREKNKGNQFSAKVVSPLEIQVVKPTLQSNAPSAIEKTIVQRLRADMQELWGSWQDRRKTGELNIFQLSAFGTNNKASHKTNVLSFNLSWGVIGALEGVQASLLGAAIRRDVSGVQMGGVFNAVGGNVIGVQAAGLFNVARGNLTGMQLSGLFNRANSTIGGQLSFGLNWSDKNLVGLQAAALGNVANASANSAQIAGLFNVTKEKSNFQAATLINKAAEIEGVQIALGMNEAKKVDGVQLGAVNYAKNVKGVQLGIINMADSVKGVSLGLFNFIKNGYNKFELGSMESAHVLFVLKMGPRSLYHIYQGGFNLWGHIWSIGGGLGTVVPLNRGWNLNIEGTVMHVNESKNWTTALNLVSQVRTSFEYKIDRGFSVFIGPSVNFMVSKYRDVNSRTLGSKLPVYTLIDCSHQHTNYRAWIGFYSGVRMTLW